MIRYWWYMLACYLSHVVEDGPCRTRCFPQLVFSDIDNPVPVAMVKTGTKGLDRTHCEYSQKGVSQI